MYRYVEKIRLFPIIANTNIYETYILHKDIDLNKICFLDNTAVQAKWIDLKELYNMIENGEIAWVLISRIEEYVIPLMKETN